MVNIMEHTKYCGGKGYVMNSFYEAKGQERVKSDIIEKLMANARDSQAKTAQQNRQLQLPVPQTLGQRFAVALAKPMLALAGALQNLQKLPLPVPQFIQNLGQRAGQKLTQTVGQLLSFFFNSKKTQNDTKDDEALEDKKREEIEDSDLFTKFVVKESHGSGMGR